MFYWGSIYGNYNKYSYLGQGSDPNERRHLSVHMLIVLVSAAGPVKAALLDMCLIRRGPPGVVDDGRLMAYG